MCRRGLGRPHQQHSRRIGPQSGGRRAFPVLRSKATAGRRTDVSGQAVRLQRGAGSRYAGISHTGCHAGGARTTAILLQYRGRRRWCAHRRRPRGPDAPAPKSAVPGHGPLIGLRRHTRVHRGEARSGHVAWARPRRGDREAGVVSETVASAYARGQGATAPEGWGRGKSDDDFGTVVRLAKRLTHPSVGQPGTYGQSRRHQSADAADGTAAGTAVSAAADAPYAHVPGQPRTASASARLHPASSAGEPCPA
jgi:hypothetical protein